MKIITLLLSAALVLFAHQAHALTESEKSVHATTYREVTGLEWLQMSIGERRDYILLSMAVLDKYGVTLSRPLLDYYNAVEQKLRIDPDFYDVNVTDILASLVYETEPETREALNKFMRKKP